MWILPPVRQAKAQIKKILGSITQVGGVLVDPDGNPIYPINKTLAQFLALTPSDVADGAVVHITDLHTTSGAGGVYATWDATASKWGQNFGTPWCFTTLSLAVASFPAASFPGWSIYIPGVGELHSDGARYVPATGQSIISKGIFGTLAAPTKNTGTGAATYTFNIGAPTIEANLLAGGYSMLNFKLRGQRHNANGTMSINARLGTTGTTADPLLWWAALAATDLLHVGADVLITFPTATDFITNMTSLQAGTGGAGQLVNRTTNVNTASNMILSIDVSGKHTNDTFDLLSYYLGWFE